MFIFQNFSLHIFTLKYKKCKYNNDQHFKNIKYIKYLKYNLLNVNVKNCILFLKYVINKKKILTFIFKW